MNLLKKYKKSGEESCFRETDDPLDYLCTLLQGNPIHLNGG